MKTLSEARKRHLIVKAFATTLIAVRGQEPMRQPLSDLDDMDTMLDELCSPFEREIAEDNAMWSLGLESLRRHRLLKLLK